MSSQYYQGISLISFKLFSILSAIIWRFYRGIFDVLRRQLVISALNLESTILVLGRVRTMQCPTLKIFQSHHLETKTQKVAD